MQIIGPGPNANASEWDAWIRNLGQNLADTFVPLDQFPMTPTGSNTIVPLGQHLSGFVNIRGFGAKGDGVTDDTAAIQRCLDEAHATGSAVMVPAGTYIISSLKLWPGQIIRGWGYGDTATCIFQQSKTVATVALLDIDGLAGTRFMHDIEIGNLEIYGPLGDQQTSGSAHGIYIHDGLFEASRIYIHDCVIAGVGGRGIFAPQMFSSQIDRVQTDLCGDNAIEIQGNNTTVIRDCYVHRVANGKAAYRVYGECTMFNCNGIDNNTPVGLVTWGDFGQSIALGDAVNTEPFITLINCNCEDFTQHGLHFRFGGAFTSISTTYILAANVTGYGIKFETQPRKGNFLDQNSRTFLKTGSVWQNGSFVTAPQTPFMVFGDGSLSTTNFFNSNPGFNVLASIPVIYTEPTLSTLAIYPLMVGQPGRGTAQVLEYERSSVAWTPGAIAAGAIVSVNITNVPFISGPVAPFGVYFTKGAFQLNAGTALPAGLIVTAQTTALNTVTVYIFNGSGAPQTLGAGVAWAFVTWVS